MQSRDIRANGLNQQRDDNISGEGVEGITQLPVLHSDLRARNPGILDPKKRPTHLNVHGGDLYERRKIYDSRQSGNRLLESANRLRATAGCRHL